MSPRRSASRTASSLRASSRERYGDQPFSPSITSTSTSAAYWPSRTSFVCRRLLIASSGESRRSTEAGPGDRPSQDASSLLSASPAPCGPAASPYDRRKCPEGFVDRGAVRKHIED